MTVLVFGASLGDATEATNLRKGCNRPPRSWRFSLPDLAFAVLRAMGVTIANTNLGSTLGGARPCRISNGGSLGLSPEQAITSATHSAATLTRATLGP